MGAPPAEAEATAEAEEDKNPAADVNINHVGNSTMYAVEFDFINIVRLLHKEVNVLRTMKVTQHLCWLF